MKKVFALALVLLASFGFAASFNHSTGTTHQQGTNNGYGGVNFTANATGVLTFGYFWAGDTYTNCILKNATNGVILVNVSRSGDMCNFGNYPIKNGLRYSIGTWAETSGAYNFGYGTPSFPIANPFATIDGGYMQYSGDSSASWGLKAFTIDGGVEGAVCGQNLGSGTHILTENQSISGANCFNITSQNVVLDCNGYPIEGSGRFMIFGTQALGSISNPLKNITIKNCIMNNFYAANVFWAVSDSQIYNITGNNSSIVGDYSHNIVYSNSTFTSEYFGFFGLMDSDFNLSDTRITITKNSGAAYLTNMVGWSGNNVFRGNTFKSAMVGLAGLWINGGSGFSFIENNITSSVWINNAGSATFSGNAYNTITETPSWALFSSLPFNSSTVGGYWQGGGYDATPYTPYIQSPPPIIEPTIPANTYYCRQTEINLSKTAGGVAFGWNETCTWIISEGKTVYIGAGC